MNPHIYTSLGYDTLRDFAARDAARDAAQRAVVAPSKGYKSVADVVAAAKAKPGALQLRAPRHRQRTHMNSSSSAPAAGIEAVHVPMKGTPEAITETIAGRADWYFAPLVSGEAR